MDTNEKSFHMPLIVVAYNLNSSNLGLPKPNWFVNLVDFYKPSFPSFIEMSNHFLIYIIFIRNIESSTSKLLMCNFTHCYSEVKRVLKPGGLYLFVEHVAARGINRLSNSLLNRNNVYCSSCGA